MYKVLVAPFPYGTRNYAPGATSHVTPEVVSFVVNFLNNVTYQFLVHGNTAHLLKVDHTVFRISEKPVLVEPHGYLHVDDAPAILHGREGRIKLDIVHLVVIRPPQFKAVLVY